MKRDHALAHPGATKAALAAALINLAMLAGCQHQDLAQQRVEVRMERMQRTFDAIKQREDSNPERLARAKAFIDQQLEEDVHKTAADMETLKWYIQREFERWEKNQPVYREWIEHELRGHPERIEENAIIMFY